MSSGEPGQEQLQQWLFAVIAEHNQTQDEAQQLALQADTVLFGADSVLDSMDLVHLVVAYEQTLAEHGYTVALADERAMSQRHSPFATVATLAAYAAELIREIDGG